MLWWWKVWWRQIFKSEKRAYFRIGVQPLDQNSQSALNFHHFLQRGRGSHCNLFWHQRREYQFIWVWLWLLCRGVLGMHRFLAAVLQKISELDQSCNWWQKCGNWMREIVDQNDRVPFDNFGSEHLDRVCHQVHDGCRPQHRSIFPTDLGWLFIFYVLPVLLQENRLCEAWEQNSGSRRQLLPGMYPPERDHDVRIHSPDGYGKQEPLVGWCSCSGHHRRIHI